MTSIVVNGTTYNVDINEININGEFLYKYAERVLSGDFKSEAIGFFENQSITFQGDNNSDFVSLYQELSTLNSEGNYNKTIEVFSPLGKYNFEMYPNSLNAKMKRLGTGLIKSWWAEMSIKFTAVSKVR